jgi:hypothetical protein
MLAISSGQVRAAADGIMEAPAARPEARRSVAAAIGHGVVIGAAATVLELLLFAVLLYLCGVIAF